MALPTPPAAEEVLATINSVQARKRLYAPSASAAIDNTVVDRYILEAWSEAHALTASAFPGGLRNANGSLDPFILGYVADMTHAKAAGRHLNASDGSGYARAGKEAEKKLAAMKRDEGPRRTEGVAAPVATAVATAAEGALSGMWNSAADGSSWSGF